MSMEKPIQTATASAALASAALDQDITFERDVELLQVLIHASENITETITLTHEGIEGPTNYTFVLDTSGLSAASNYVFRPTGHCVFKKNDILNVAVTNANTTGTVYSKVQYREVG